MRTAFTVFAILAVTLAIPTSFADEATDAHLALLNQMLSGTHCQGTPTDGLQCTYRLGTLEIAIGNVGGATPIVAFNHSDSDDEFYAVMYSGCIAVIHTRKEMAKHE